MTQPKAKKICKVLLNNEDMRYTVSFDNGECKQYEEKDTLPIELIAFIANSKPEYIGNFYIIFNQ